MTTAKKPMVGNANINNEKMIRITLALDAILDAEKVTPEEIGFLAVFMLAGMDERFPNQDVPCTMESLTSNGKHVHWCIAEPMVAILVGDIGEDENEDEDTDEPKIH